MNCTLDQKHVEQAIETVLASGSSSKQHVTNCLNRLLDVPRLDPVQTPPALLLAEEPKANAERYDHLRRKSHVQ